MEVVKVEPSFYLLLCFNILLLFSLLFTTAIADDDDDDDSAAMAMLAENIKPTPPNWSSGSSSASDYCQWQCVQCESNRVTAIDLDSMSLTSIPSQFPPLPYLNVLKLSRNSLSGSFPSLATLTSLQVLFLQENNFTSIPPAFFTELATTLQVLILSDNPFLPSWTIPTELSSFQGLGAFFCDRANLTGQIPDIFHSMPLENLSLSQNNLLGPLPDSFGVAPIKRLWAHDQKLSGPIQVLSNMTHLVEVALYGNQFTGPIPDLSNCTSLVEMRLDNNSLTGLVPPSPDWPSNSNLQVINLTTNKLQGPFPVWLLTKQRQQAYLDDNNYCTNSTSSCDVQVETLLEIASGFGYPVVLSDVWVGNDACNDWKFIWCNLDKNVHAIDFGMQHFGGTISPAFANFPALEYLLLNDNNLTGPIPDSLTNLPNLKVLDVSNNNLSGKIPAFDPSVKLKINGNPSLLTGKTGKRRAFKVIIIIASVLGAIGGFLCAFLLGKWVAKHGASKERSRVPNSNREESFSKSWRRNVLGKNNNRVRLGELQVLSFEKLAAATNNFHPANKLGQGGFGPVYWGRFPDGQEIAVKRLSRASEQGLEEFMNEVEVISSLQHRNLVKLVGCCAGGEEKMLVYEYLPNRSLDAFLFDPQSQRVIDWRKRFNIIEGIGRGLLYLHRDSGLRIIHRDLKASNILLDEDLNPKISDFGMARIFQSNEDQANTKRVVGTYGYMSPEYAMEGQFSEKSDVFSFGVLLLEIISGRKNTSFYNDEHSLSLLAHAWKLWNEENILAFVDPRICAPNLCWEFFRCIHVGLLCVENFKGDRPNMSTVVSMLSGEMENLPSPKQPAFTDRKTSMDRSLSMENQCSINSATLTIVEAR